MNYSKHYDRLINRAKNRNITGYTEKHHIIPRCMGGEDKGENLVRLTAREHFIAHLLLWKMYPNSKGLINAVQIMCVHSSGNRVNNRMYSWLKKKFSEEMSSKQCGKNNSQYGTMWIYNIERMESIKIDKSDFAEYNSNGWLKGRKMSFDFIQKLECDKIHFEKLRDEYEISGLSLHEFCIKNNISEQSLVKNWNKHRILYKKTYKTYQRKHEAYSHKGSNNSQYGTKYIHNDFLKEQKRVKRSEIEKYIVDGWKLGQLYLVCDKCNKRLPYIKYKNHKCELAQSGRAT